MKTIAIALLALVAAPAIADDDGDVDRVYLSSAPGAPPPTPPTVLELTQKCDAKDAAACARLGYEYEKGELVGRCPALAAHFYAEACKLGSKTNCRASLHKLYRSLIRDLKKVPNEDPRIPYRDIHGARVSYADRQDYYWGLRDKIDRAKEMDRAIMGKRDEAAEDRCWAHPMPLDGDPRTMISTKKALEGAGRAKPVTGGMVLH